MAKRELLFEVAQAANPATTSAVFVIFGEAGEVFCLPQLGFARN